MPSDKVKMILMDKSDIPEDVIDKMTDAEGWRWIYGNRPKSEADTREHICFTGFRPAEKERLYTKAEEAGMRVVKTVSKKLVYLCIGSNAGPKKMEKAQAQGATILTEEQLDSLIATGEMP